ncbi:MAG: type II toxin-antitoxin system RelE/ParE family toxin [Longimicrobiales bacterium]|nr:type II toxin-antitoxin system RelE/ParE family toxin [Longimicrobiales bacterium]
MAAPLKPVHWIASSLSDLRGVPGEVQHSMGYALFRAQEGKKAPEAKPLTGIVSGAGVLEIVEDYGTDTYRVVYTVRFAEVVYVLHAFQKKSKRGRQTPKHEIDLIRRRYAAARTHYESIRRDLR